MEEVPSDCLKAVGKIELISQETEDVYCSFIADTWIRIQRFKKFYAHKSVSVLLCWTVLAISL